jgi:cell division septum initiation protein DivIVA
MKTKHQEIEILSEAAKTLGADSYCGPLLEMLIPQIEREIKSDICPEFDLRKTHADCQAVRELAKSEVEQMIKAAQKEAERIVKEAEKYSFRQKDIILGKISDMRDLIEGTAHVSRDHFTGFSRGVKVW